MKQAVRVCPNCGSTDIRHDSLSVISRLSLSGSRECRDCGYSGIFPEADPDEVAEFDGADDAVVEGGGPAPQFRRGRFGIGVVLFLLGVGAVSSASWGNGLLAGFLAVVVGAAVAVDELSTRFHAGK